MLRNPKLPRGAAHHSAKLSEYEAGVVRALADQGYDLRAIRQITGWTFINANILYDLKRRASYIYVPNMIVEVKLEVRLP